MLRRAEIRLLILHEFKLGRTVTKATSNIIKAWGEQLALDRNVRRWFKKFHEGETELEDAERQGRPNVVVDEEFKEHVEANTSVTVRQLSQELSISPATAWRHLKGLNKVKKLEKWIPHELSESQCLLLHDNAKPHVSRFTVQHLNLLGYEILPHPPYSPDLSPTDYHLFFQFDLFVRGKKLR